MDEGLDEDQAPSHQERSSCRPNGYRTRSRGGSVAEGTAAVVVADAVAVEAEGLAIQLRFVRRVHRLKEFDRAVRFVVTHGDGSKERYESLFSDECSL